MAPLAYGSKSTSPLPLAPRKKPEPIPWLCNTTPPNEIGLGEAGFTTLPLNAPVDVD